LNVDELRADDIIYHKAHGLLSVSHVEYEDGKKSTFNCLKRSKGENKDAEVIVKREDVLNGDITKYVKVGVKIHLASQESSIFDLEVNIDSSIGDLLQSLGQASNQAYNVFASGVILQLKKTFADYDLGDGSKILLFPVEGATSKPEGVRWFCRFPDHNITELLYVGCN
jgi:hypothetical protein